METGDCYDNVHTVICSLLITTAIKENKSCYYMHSDLFRKVEYLTVY